jgi:hypothetical protein
MLPAPSPTSYGTPAQAARSPSPEPSTNSRPRIAHRPDSRLRLDEHGVDAALVGHHDARAERVEQHLDARLGHELVGCDLERRDVVGKRRDLVLHRQVRLVEPVHRGEPLEDVVSDAVHDLLVLAVHHRVQAAEGA